MHPRMNDYSAEMLISSIEESLREFWGNWGQAPQSDLYDGADMMRLYTGVPYKFCNGVVCSQFSPDHIDTVIDETVAYFEKRNAAWEWIVGPYSQPASVEKFLEKHGLSMHGEPIGMAINLDTMSQDIPLPDHLKIEPARDDNSLKIWVKTMVEGFEAPSIYPTFFSLELSLGCSQQAYRRYLGLIDGQPISTCALFLGKHVAGIYCVSTIRDARKLGIGAAITQYALKEARAMGYHIAVLQSTPMGRSVYRQLGFQELSVLRCYCPDK